jgi:hypothetical protein
MRLNDGLKITLYVASFWDKLLGRLTYGQIVKALNVAHLDGFNKYNPGKNSAFLNADGFTKQEMQDIMIEAITERIDTISPQSLI